MIKLNRKIRCNSPKTKVKLPKIEINECKLKNRDQRKLENEMFKQAKEAQILLDKLLSEEGLVDEEYCRGRTRSNSLNATMENLLSSKHQERLNKSMKPRGSVPTIAAHITKFFRSRDNSPNTSPVTSPRSARKVSPLTSPASSPDSLRRDKDDDDKENLNEKNNSNEKNEENMATCTSYKNIDIDSKQEKGGEAIMENIVKENLI